MAREKRKPIHYVNNKDFVAAVVEYVTRVEKARKNDQPLPIVPDYIAECFLKMAEGLSHKSNFIRYTFREEMVMDAVENCLKAIENYNIHAPTRTGKPNAFGYFTQISYFAFLRRIAKEQKQQDIKFKYMSEASAEAFIANSNGDTTVSGMADHFVDTLRDKMDKYKETEDEETVEKQRLDKEKKQAVKADKADKKLADSNLEEFL